MKLKFFFTCLVALIITCSGTAMAGTPGKMVVQAVLSNADTGLYVGTWNMTVGFFTSTADSATALYSSGSKLVYFNNGWFTLTLGDPTPIPSDVFNNDDIQIRIDINGEKVFLPLTTVPYAMNSEYTDEANGFYDAEFFAIDRTNERIGIGTSSPQASLHVTGDIKSDALIEAATLNATLIEGKLKGDGSEVINLLVENIINLDKHSLDSSDGSREDMVFVTADGKIGIGGVTFPREDLEVSGNVLFSGVHGGGTAAAITGQGTRFQWIPNLSALRAGFVSATQWDNINIGAFSMAFGRNVTASGSDSVSIGNGNTASGSSSATVGGANNVASHISAVVIGGDSNTAAANNASVLGGEGNQANAESSVITGGKNNTTQGAYSSVGGGEGNTTAGQYAVVPGGSHNKADGKNSVAMGQKAEALFDGNFVFRDNTSGSAFQSTKINQFLIQAANGVGIGTANPIAELSVVGDGVFTGSLTASSFVGDGSGLTNVGGGFWTQNGSNLSYNTGAIGIGTSGPGADLHIKQSNKADLIIETTGAVDSLITLKNANRQSSIIVDTSDNFIFRDEDDSLNRMVINNNGNVGIATSDPVEELSVVGDGLFTGTVTAAIFKGDGSQLTGISGGGGGDGISTANFVLADDGVVSTPSISFDNESTMGMYRANPGIIGFATNAIERMRISVLGVGIGTSNPTAELSVSGDALISGTVTATSFVGDGSSLTNLSAGSSDTSITANVAITALTADTATTANVALSVIANGVDNVAIQDDAVTMAKIADSSAVTNQVIKYDGSNWAAANTVWTVSGSNTHRTAGNVGIAT
ncbi:hypothetical protein HOH87_03420, partial [bacterium]|nr:hypothetical protein [bacterium]